MIGGGFGFVVLLGVAGGEVTSAIGVGGFLVMLGLAFLVNSWLETRDAQPSSTPSPSGSTEPPSAPGS